MNADTTTTGCGSQSCACASLAQPSIASINGIGDVNAITYRLFEVLE